MTLNDYLCRRAGNEPDAMIIHGTPRTVYRDYKGRGVLVAVGPDTYDVVRATTETDIETLYARGEYERWRWDGNDVHRVEVKPVVMAGPVAALPDTRPTAHRLIVTPATLRRAESLGFVPGSGDVLLWALRAAEGWREEWQRADAAAMALAEGASRFQDERDAARRDLARIVQLCGWDCDGNDPETPAGAIHLYGDAVQAVRELVEERDAAKAEIVKLRDLCSRAAGMIDTVDGAAYMLSERLRVAGGD